MDTPEIWIIILIHQILFQGLFFGKNMLLRRRLGTPIRGNNPEALVATIFFTLFIVLAFGISLVDQTFGQIPVIGDRIATGTALTLLGLSLVISTASLIHLKDSWRVGVLENQKTELVRTGIYRFSRNPYFASYILVFAAYTIILQNLLLAGFTLLNLLLVHRMVRKEEAYLQSVHGEEYASYRRQVPRYFIF